MKKIITCIVCKKPLKGRQRSYCSASCKNKNNQSYKNQQLRGLKRKIVLVKKMGGKCSICGYSKKISALTFHHTKSSNKKFQLDLRSLSNRKQIVINVEARKCILICHNCHSELHHPKLNLDLFT
jgi:hypothetical protein